MKILVTGSQSFVGKTLVPHLQRAGYEVCGISRTGSPSQYTVVGDLSDSSTYEELPSDIDAIVHLAATTSPPNYSANDLFLNNVESTRRLVEFAKKTNIDKFIYASSISVYGDITSQVLEESASITNPSPYGISKLTGELLLQEVQDQLSAVSLRLPAIIGKGATRHWLANVYQKLTKNDEIEIYNSSSKFNNCIHVENLSVFISELLYTKNIGSHVVNLGCHEEISIDECVTSMAGLLGVRAKLRYVDHHKPSFTINMDRAVELGFKPWTVKESLTRWIH